MHKPLQTGDEIRIVAPSQSYSKKKKAQYQRAQERLEALGHKVTFGKNIERVAMLGTASGAERAQDLNDAYADKHVKAIVAMHGGWSANEVLPLLNWKLIQQNPKPLIGYSDTTVLLNAIYAKTGNIGYLGPNFGTHGHDKLWEFSLDNFDGMLKHTVQQLQPSKRWMSNGDGKAHKTKWSVINEGEAAGTLIGGNLGTFYLVQGTEYQPAFKKPFILAIEEDNQSGVYTPDEFSRRLESILQLPRARKNLRGMLIGRFEHGGLVSDKLLHQILAQKQLDIPVVAGMDFGHTIPMLSLPIGGHVRMSASGATIAIKV